MRSIFTHTYILNFFTLKNVVINKKKKFEMNHLFENVMKKLLSHGIVFTIILSSLGFVVLDGLEGQQLLLQLCS